MSRLLDAYDRLPAPLWALGIIAGTLVLMGAAFAAELAVIGAVAR